MNVGKNIDLILRRKALFTFIKTTKMMSFDSHQEKPASAHKESSFIYHPSMTEENKHIMAQLWYPFLPEFNLSSKQDNLSEWLVTDLVKVGEFIQALKGCKKRLFGLSGTPLSNITIDSSFAKNRFSKNSNNVRGGEMIFFVSYYKKKV